MREFIQQISHTAAGESSTYSIWKRSTSKAPNSSNMELIYVLCFQGMIEMASESAVHSHYRYKAGIKSKRWESNVRHVVRKEKVLQICKKQWTRPLEGAKLGAK